MIAAAAQEETMLVVYRPLTYMNKIFFSTFSRLPEEKFENQIYVVTLCMHFFRSYLFNY